jgi:hypothetical protein
MSRATLNIHARYFNYIVVIAKFIPMARVIFRMVSRSYERLFMKYQLYENC